MAFLPGAVPDESTFTAGTSPLTPVGGVWDDSLAALTTGQVGELRITEKRAAHVNLRGETGTELATASAPLRVDPTGTTKQPVTLFDGSGNAITSTSGSLNVNITGGAGGLSVVDEAAWTAGTSVFTPDGAVFNDSAAALTSGQQGTGRQTPNRARHVNLRNQAGTEIGTATNPVAALGLATYSAGIVKPFVRANKRATLAVTVLAATAIVPGLASNYVYISSVELIIDAASFNSGAAVGLAILFFSDTTSGELLWFTRVILPAAAPTITTVAPTPLLVTPPGFFYSSSDLAAPIVVAVSSSSGSFPTNAAINAAVTYGYTTELL